MTPGGRRSGPPSRLERWLGACVPEGAAGRSSVLGDLHEEWRELHDRRGRLQADLWYLLQLILVGGPWLVLRLRNRLGEIASGIGLDVRASYRGLKRQPSLVVVAILSIGFGTGLVSATATVVNGAWFAPLPWADAGRMFVLEDTHPTDVPASLSPGTSLRTFESWRSTLPAGVFSRLEAHRRSWSSVQVGQGARTQLRVLATSGGYAELLDYSAVLGRTIEPSDRSGAPTAVLSHALWQSAFSRSPDVLGQTVEVEGVDHTVIGVLSADARVLEEAEVFIPLPTLRTTDDLATRGVQVLGVLTEDASVQVARSAVAAATDPVYAEAPELNDGWSATASPLRLELRERGLPPESALLLAALSLAVLLVAALNLASLLLARTTQRTRELGVRAALGAGSARVAVAALMDGLLLAGMGGALGLAVVWAARDIALARFADGLPGWASFPLDLRVMAATLGGTLFAALVVGLFPVLRAIAIGRSSGLAESASGPRGRRTSRAGDLLLGTQIVVGLLLVTASASSLNAFRKASDFSRLGYRTEGLTGVIVGFEDGVGTQAAFARLAPFASSHPRIADHTLTRPLPLRSGGFWNDPGRLRVDGAAAPLANSATPGRGLAVGPRYFELNRIAMEAGRPIADSDGPGAPPVAVVSSDAVPMLWPGRAAGEVIGEVIDLEAEGVRTSYTIVGVSAAVILDPAGRSLDPLGPTLYPAIRQTPDVLFGSGAATLQLRVETSGVPPTFREWSTWVSDQVPGAAVSRTYGVEDFLRESVRPLLITGGALGTLALLVLTLLGIGIYGTVAYRIASSREDIGIRLALGAAAADVVRSVVGPLVRVVAISIGIGAVVAAAAGPVLASGGIGTGGFDPLVLTTVAVVVASAAALATIVPLRRALGIDPVGSLRAD